MRRQRMTTIAALGMALVLLPLGVYAQSGAAAGGLPNLPRGGDSGLPGQ